MLIYDGINLLSTREMESIQRQIDAGYPYIIEVSDYPRHVFLKELLKTRTWSQEVDGWGDSETQQVTGVLYGTIRRGESGGFFMLKDKDDYDTVIKCYPDLIASTKPFRSIISLG